MTRFFLACLAVLTAAAVRPAACEVPQAAAPFPTVAIETPPRPSHRLAWATLMAGAGLVAMSFPLTEHANRAYDDYLDATDPPRVEQLYEETVRYDRLSSASLLTGEALIATGIWLRFVHRPAAPSGLLLSSRRCALSWRF